MYNQSEIGNRIYIARKKLNLKQSDICKVLRIKQSAYSDIENGKRTLKVDELFLLSEALNVPVAWLLCLNNDEPFTASELLKIEEFKQYIIGIRKSN